MTETAARRLPPCAVPVARLALSVIALILLPTLVPAATASAQLMGAGRQVTVFGVLATPGNAKDDPKLKDVISQLRMLVPNHSFKLLKVESKRVAANETVSCDLGDGFVAASTLIAPLDPNGKVQMRFDFSAGGFSQYQTIVTTPPNQIVYINRVLPNGERLILGIGAR